MKMKIAGILMLGSIHAGCATLPSPSPTVEEKTPDNAVTHSDKSLEQQADTDKCKNIRVFKQYDKSTLLGVLASLGTFEHKDKAAADCAKSKEATEKLVPAAIGPETGKVEPVLPESVKITPVKTEPAIVQTSIPAPVTTPTDQGIAKADAVPVKTKIHVAAAAPVIAPEKTKVDAVPAPVIAPVETKINAAAPAPVIAPEKAKVDAVPAPVIAPVETKINAAAPAPVIAPEKAKVVAVPAPVIAPVETKINAAAPTPVIAPVKTKVDAAPAPVTEPVKAKAKPGKHCRVKHGAVVTKISQVESSYLSQTITTSVKIYKHDGLKKQKQDLAKQEAELDQATKTEKSLSMIEAELNDILNLEN